MSKLNVYQRIMDVRLDLLEMEVPKSGKNRFSHYFELEELIPRITKACSEHGIICITSFKNDLAMLKVVNLDDPLDVAIITSPMPPADKLNKGVNLMQSIGANETYQRRYLYVNAFDIIEKEVLDSDEVISENIKDVTHNDEFTTADKDHKLTADNNVVSMVSGIKESLTKQGVKVDESSILFRAKAMLRRKQIDEKMLEDITSFVKAEA